MPISPVTIAATRSALTAEPSRLPPPTEPNIYRLDASPLQPTLPPVSTLTFSQCNDWLSAGAQSAMVHMRNTMEEGFSYNTLNDLFTICDRAKTLQAQAHPAPFTAAWSMGPPDIEPDISAPYAGGTCFALAPLLQQRITHQLGFKAYVVGTYGGMNILTKWPGLAVEGFEENQEALGRLGHITHADVVVPVRVFAEAPMRLLHIQCGLGPSRHHWQMLQMPRDQAQIEALRLLPDPAMLRWLSISSCLTHYLADPARNVSFGIDLLAGNLFLSSAAARTLPFAMQGRSFHFAHLMRDEALAQFGDDAERQEVIEGWAKAHRYLSTIAQGFSQPPQFVEQVIYLMRHRDAVMNELLLAPAATLSACRRWRDDAMEVRGPIERLLQLWHLEPDCDALSEARAALRSAAEMVQAGRTFQAEFAYTRAQTTYLKAVEDIAPEVERFCRRNAGTLQPLPRDELGRLPRGLFQAAARGLLRADATHKAYHRVTDGVSAEGRSQIEHTFGVTGAR